MDYLRAIFSTLTPVVKTDETVDSDMPNIFAKCSYSKPSLRLMIVNINSFSDVNFLFGPFFFFGKMSALIVFEKFQPG